MRPIQHPTANDVLRAPPGVPIEECVPLAITRLRHADGVPAVVSYWSPNEQELALLNLGQPVRLWVQGHTHPPISLGVDGDDVL